MKITSVTLNNLAPEKFFRGGQIDVDERSKILECDRNMKAFLIERNNAKLEFCKIEYYEEFNTKKKSKNFTIGDLDCLLYLPTRIRFPIRFPGASKTH